MANTLNMYENVIPLLAPVDKVATAWASPWVDLKTAHECRFYLFTGLLTSATADTAGITVECACEAGSDSEAAVAFSYRYSGAVGANTWSAVTACTATGFDLNTGTDGLLYEIEVDPAVVTGGNTNKNARYVRLVSGAWSDTIAASLVACWAELRVRYPQTTMVSVTGAT